MVYHNPYITVYHLGNPVNNLGSIIPYIPQPTKNVFIAHLVPRSPPAVTSPRAVVLVPHLWTSTLLSWPFVTQIELHQPGFFHWENFHIFEKFNSIKFKKLSSWDLFFKDSFTAFFRLRTRLFQDFESLFFIEMLKNFRSCMKEPNSNASICVHTQLWHSQQ